jgi:hypothetical protein
LGRLDDALVVALAQVVAGDLVTLAGVDQELVLFGLAHQQQLAVIADGH